MAMSKKHYQKIAEAMAGVVEESGTVPDPTKPKERVVPYDKVIGALSRVLQADNPNFRPHQFRTACGLDD